MDQIHEEASLIRKAKNDPAAFGALYDRYYSRILRFVLNRTGSVELAQDVTAETFFQALKHLWRFRLAGRPFGAWLYRIASARVAQHYRNRYRRCELSLEECPELISQLSGGSARAHTWPDPIGREAVAVRTLLSTLKPAQQDVLTLRYFQDYSLEQIAVALDLPLNTVKSHLRRGLERLRKLLTAQAGTTSYVPPQSNPALAAGPKADAAQ